MKSELANRVIFGLIAATFGLLVVYQGGYIFFAAVLLVSFIISLEFDNLRKDGKICFMFVALPILFSYHPQIAIGLAMLAVILITLVDILFKTNNPWLTISTAYVSLPAISLIWLRNQENGFQLLLWLLLVIIATDTGAYFVGRKFGKTLLAPKISPKKTWEGLTGGIVAAMIVSYAYSENFRFVLLAIIFAVLGQASDLLESSIKRYYGVKDTGKILPGHGGAMDRLDALVLTAPIAALLVGFGIIAW